MRGFQRRDNSFGFGKNPKRVESFVIGGVSIFHPGEVT